MGSSSSSNSTRESTTVTVDRRIAADGEAIIAAEGSTVEDLSDEALAELVGFGEDALDFAGQEGEGTRETLERLYEQTISVVGESVDFARDTQSALADNVTATALEAFERSRSDAGQGFKELLYAGVAIAAITGAAVVLSRQGG